MKSPSRLPLIILTLGTAGLLAIWLIVAILGPGTFHFWNWNTQSWQSVATAVTGLALAYWAARTWQVQRIQTAILEQQIDPNLYGATIEDPKFDKIFFRDERIAAPGAKPSFDPETELYSQDGLLWTLRVVNPGEVPLILGGIELSLLGDSAKAEITVNEHGLTVFVLDDYFVLATGWVSTSQILQNLSHLALGVFVPENGTPKNLPFPLNGAKFYINISYRTFRDPSTTKHFRLTSAPF